MKLNLAYKLIVSIFFLDVFFIFLHFALGKDNSYFHLDVEQNFPTYFQGFKLLTISATSLTLALLLRYIFLKSKKVFVLLLTHFIFFAYLAIDELAQVHENIKNIFQSFNLNAEGFVDQLNSIGYNSTEWLIFYIPLLGLGFLLMMVFAYYLYKISRKNSYIYVLGILCFILVPFVEYFSIKLPRESTEYGLLIILEESLELFGASFILAALILLLWTLIRSSRIHNRV